MSSPETTSADHNEHHHHDHHVHFDQTVIKDNFEADNSIIYQKSSSGDTITVHLGFLQINHRYNLELEIPMNLFKTFKNADHLQLVPDTNAVPNIYCKFTEFLGKSKTTPNHYDMKVEFFAHKEKLLKEELKLVNSKNLHEKVKFIFNARVLGRGKGTPMLRNGIHCIGIEADEESEASDWQGFSRTDTDD